MCHPSLNEYASLQVYNNIYNLLIFQYEINLSLIFQYEIDSSSVNNNTTNISTCSQFNILIDSSLYQHVDNLIF